MKKISFLLLLISLLFIPSIFVKAEEVEPTDIDNLIVDITGRGKTTIDLHFTTLKELENLEIWIYSNLNDGTGELVYSYKKFSDPEFVPIHSMVGPTVSEPYYKYDFRFNLNSGKIGTFEIVLRYNIDSNSGTERYSQSIYVTSGNANLDLDLFTTKNAILIGVIATVFSIIGTMILISYSEKNAQISDEEE